MASRLVRNVFSRRLPAPSLYSSTQALRSWPFQVHLRCLMAIVASSPKKCDKVRQENRENKQTRRFFNAKRAFVMRGSGVQIPPAAPAKSGVQRKSMHSSAGSNEPEGPVFDPLNADLCDPEIAILSAVSRRQIAGPIAPGDTLITTIGLLASN